MVSALVVPFTDDIVCVDVEKTTVGLVTASLVVGADYLTLWFASFFGGWFCPSYQVVFVTFDAARVIASVCSELT